MFIDLERELISLINAQKAEVCISLAYPRLDYYFGRIDNLQMHAASTMKVPVMIEVFRQADSGLISLDHRLVVHNEFKSIVDQTVFHLDANEDSEGELYSKIGADEKIIDLVFGMITSSGNLAANLLIDLVGVRNIQNTIENIVGNGMSVLRGVEDIKAFQAGKNNTTNAVALTRLFSALAANRVNGVKNCKPMIDILFAQKFHDGLPAKLPKNISVAHKTGWITGHTHDAGIIYLTKQNWYVLSILTQGFEKQDQANKCIARISRIIWDFLKSK